MYGGKIIEEWKKPIGDNVHDIHVNMDSVAYVERPKNLNDVYIATFVNGKSIYIDAYTYNQMSRWIDERYLNYENYG
jgi:hypothetical protein